METMSTMKTGVYAQRLAYTFMDSPVGRLMLAGDERGLWMLSFAREDRSDTPVEDRRIRPVEDRQIRTGDAWRASETPFRDVRRQLDAYFDGELRSVRSPAAPRGNRVPARSLERASFHSLRINPVIWRACAQPLASQRRFAPWAGQTTRIPLPSWSRATASSAPTESSSDTAAAWTPRTGCLRSSAGTFRVAALFRATAFRPCALQLHVLEDARNLSRVLAGDIEVRDETDDVRARSTRTRCLSARARGPRRPRFAREFGSR